MRVRRVDETRTPRYALRPHPPEGHEDLRDEKLDVPDVRDKLKTLVMGAWEWSKPAASKAGVSS